MTSASMLAAKTLMAGSKIREPKSSMSSVRSSDVQVVSTNILRRFFNYGLSAFQRSIGLSLHPIRVSRSRGKVISLPSLCPWLSPSGLITLFSNLGFQIFSAIMLYIITYIHGICIIPLTSFSKSPGIAGTLAMSSTNFAL